MTGTLRPYQTSDRDIVCKLLEEGLAPYGLGVDYNDTDQDILDVQVNYQDNGGAFMVLTVNDGAGDVIIGMYGIYRMDQQRCELRKMYLNPVYKGRGFGKQLMNDALERAQQLGFSEMHLETNSCLVEAIGMYQRFGFEISDEAGHAERCDVCMSRVLG